VLSNLARLEKTMKCINTHYLKTLIFMSIVACLLNPAAYAESNNTLQGIKLGFGYDLGLGLTAQTNKFNGFIGNGGVAADYIFEKENIKDIEVSIPLYWYIGAGGYAEWKGGAGARMPIGLEAAFAKKLDAYVQIIPEFKLVDDVKFGLGAGFGVRYKF
jgi:hypothetical protein